MEAKYKVGMAMYLLQAMANSEADEWEGVNLPPSIFREMEIYFDMYCKFDRNGVLEHMNKNCEDFSPDHRSMLETVFKTLEIMS